MTFTSKRTAVLGFFALVFSACAGWTPTPVEVNGASDVAAIVSCVTTEESVSPPPQPADVLADCGALAIDDLIAFLSSALAKQTAAGNGKAAAVTTALIAKYKAYKATMPHAGAK